MPSKEGPYRNNREANDERLKQLVAKLSLQNLTLKKSLGSERKGGLKPRRFDSSGATVSSRWARA
jgi:hypothetical protein